MSGKEIAAKGIETVVVDFNSHVVMVRHPRRQSEIYYTGKRSMYFRIITDLKKNNIGIVDHK